MPTYPKYTNDMQLDEQIAACIEFEIAHGGSYLAAARAILRDIDYGHIPLRRYNKSAQQPNSADRTSSALQSTQSGGG